jgi:hypothetical protein
MTPNLRTVTTDAGTNSDSGTSVPAPLATSPPTEAAIFSVEKVNAGGQHDVVPVAKKRTESASTNKNQGKKTKKKILRVTGTSKKNTSQATDTSDASSDDDSDSNDEEGDGMGTGTGKRGNQGGFRGERLRFLESKVPEYLAQDRPGKTRWLNSFFDLWFIKFPWHKKNVPEEFKAIEPVPAPTLANPDATRAVTIEESGLMAEEYESLTKKKDACQLRKQKKAKNASNKPILT